MDKSKNPLLKGLYGFRFTLLSIGIGFLVGALVLLAAGYNPFVAYSVILQGIFSRANYISYTIIYATPLILTGLSVAFSFKTGLFNIGAEGQYIIGSLAAALLGACLQLPAVLHIPVCMLGAALAAGLWGAFAGFLKSRFGVNEVISTIMLNWIAFYLNNYIVTLPFIKRGNNVTEFIQPTAGIELLPQWRASEAGLALRESSAVINDIFRTPVNVGILVAIAVCLVVRYLLNNTSTGYSLRLVGDNQSCAQYNGINVKRSIVLAMFICGAVAGLAGAMQVLGNTRNVAELSFTEGYGFNGIAVALIAGNSPVGCIFSGLFFAALTYGGPKIQNVLGAPREVVDIVIGTIIFFIAAPKLVTVITRRWRQLRKNRAEGRVPQQGEVTP